MSRSVTGDAVIEGVEHNHRIHSEEMEFGYGGSGPADLAFNILAMFEDTAFADRFYQEFKWEVINKVPRSGASLLKEDIEEWIESRK